jgi:TRAP-type C4-dicarboxylate transport system permease small subunit
VRLVIIGFLAIIGWEGLGLAVFNAPQLSAAMEIPMTIPYLAIPVGATMMIIDLIADIFQDYFPTAIPMDASSRLEPEESATPLRITRNSP